MGCKGWIENRRGLSFESTFWQCNFKIPEQAENRIKKFPAILSPGIKISLN